MACTVKTEACQCQRAACGHIWIPRSWSATNHKLPRCCARCKSPYWQTERSGKVKKIESTHKTDTAIPQPGYHHAPTCKCNVCETAREYRRKRG